MYVTDFQDLKIVSLIIKAITVYSRKFKCRC